MFITSAFELACNLLVRGSNWMMLPTLRDAKKCSNIGEWVPLICSTSPSSYNSV